MAIITCTPKRLPDALFDAAIEDEIKGGGKHAARLNGARVEGTGRASLSLLRSVRWKASKGVKLTVGFFDSPQQALRDRIISHMNAWAKTANVQFTETKGQAQVRIAFEPDGYWSYLGTDVLRIPKDEQTMNLEAFTMATPDSEFFRVVRHETGHTLGFPHEHMRADLVKLIDEQKAIAFYMANQGWTAEEVRAQVLTPIEAGSLIGTPRTDGDSIMCYQIPGSITKDGKPIPGGTDIDELDYEFAGAVYPKPKPKPKPGQG